MKLKWLRHEETKEFVSSEEARAAFGMLPQKLKEMDKILLDKGWEFVPTDQCKTLRSALVELRTDVVFAWLFPGMQKTEDK